MSQLINKPNCNRIHIVETGIGNWEEIQKTQEDKRMRTKEDREKARHTCHYSPGKEEVWTGHATLDKIMAQAFPRSKKAIEPQTGTAL